MIWINHQIWWIGQTAIELRTLAESNTRQTLITAYNKNSKTLRVKPKYASITHIHQLPLLTLITTINNCKYMQKIFLIILHRNLAAQESKLAATTLNNFFIMNRTPWIARIWETMILLMMRNPLVLATNWMSKITRWQTSLINTFLKPTKTKLQAIYLMHP